jgi:lipopolysaccharide assembly protein A
MNSAATSAQVPVPAAPPARGIKRTRAGELWVTAGFFAVILLLLLIFILENTQRVSIRYFGVHLQPPLGAAVMMAAVLGVLLVAIPGTWRIIQLRRAARKQQHAAAK